MKKSIICVSFMLLAALRVSACGPFTNIHNYYMMKAVSDPNPNLFYDRVGEYWNGYVGTTGSYFDDNCALLMNTARKKGDKEMMAYIQRIAQYKKIAASRQETWNYPTRQELARQKVQIQQMRLAAINYKGQRLRPQYTLLLMRANLLDNRYPQNATIWKTRGVKLKSSVFRDMCENIYASSLLKAGQRKAACDIYARQGDVQSLQWAMRNFTHVDGIRAIYQEDANSPVLPWLVQNFVNSVQENDDCERLPWANSEKGTYKPAAQQFIRLALQAIHDGKSQEPALWQTAIAMTHYTLGDAMAAERESKEAMTLKGTTMELNCARCVHLLAYTKARLNEKDTKDYTDYVAGELKWLDAQRSKTISEDYFAYAYDRVMSQNLISHYRKQGDLNMAALLTGILDVRSTEIQLGDAKNYTPGNGRNYGNAEYFCRLDSMTSTQLKDYVTFLQGNGDNALQKYALQANSYRNADYFNDLLATKLMAEGQFAEALPYLRQVPLNYVQRQGLAFYMARRDFHASRWMKHQLVKDEDFWPDENFHESALTANQKIAFCEDMNSLLSAYRLANQQAQPKLALQLASRYVQASCYGDCWYLTHYEKSVSDSARAWEKDFAAEAKKYLEVARQDPALQQESLYAEAYIQLQVSNSLWWYRFENYDYDVMSDFRVKQAYDALAQCYQSNSSNAEPYLTRCDILQKYIHPQK
jgi:hypothetical protein